MKNLVAFFFLLLNMTISNLFGSPETQNKTPYKKVLDSPVVISLSRHNYRYETTKPLMEQAGFTNIRRFEGIDGLYTEENFFRNLNIIHNGAGIKGCAASHLLLWREFFNSSDSRKYLFVCEDDMLPHSEFDKLFPKFWKNTPDDFDIVFVGNKIKLDKIFTHELIIRKKTMCTHAYIITKEGAKKLYNLYMQIPETNKALHVIDIFLANSMRYNKIENYYSYNSKDYPDELNIKLGNIKRNGTGLCFQNNNLGSVIHAKTLRE